MKLILLLFIACSAWAQKNTVEEKVKRLRDLTTKASQGPVEMESEQIQYYTSVPRNYSLFVVATAMEATYGCQPCRYVTIIAIIIIIIT